MSRRCGAWGLLPPLDASDAVTDESRDVMSVVDRTDSPYGSDAMLDEPSCQSCGEG